MFHPADHPMERGWVGRVDGDRVIHLAAQTLQSFFTGGGTAREHSVYPRADVRFLAPVLHPPSVRVFEDEEAFAFANPAAMAGPGARVEPASLRSDNARPDELCLLPRLCAVVGGDEQLAGFTILAEWRAPERPVPKDRDFALGLGPTVVTPDALDPTGAASVSADGRELSRGPIPRFDWSAAREVAAAGTVLRPGDLLAGPPLGVVRGPRGRVEIALDPIGTLCHQVS